MVVDRLSAPQQNAIGAYFANLLRKVEQDSGPEFLPRGLDVMGLVRQLALPSAETVEKLSYGDPLFRMPTQSNIPITTDRGYVAEVLGMAPAVPAASRATTRISNEMADQLVKAIMGNPQATAPAVLEAAGQMAPLARMFKPEQVKAVLPDTKAVDASGNPVMVYHGTADPIEQFSKSKLGESTRAQSAKQGFFFQENPQYARNYADYAANNARVQALVDKAYEAEKKGDWDSYDNYLRQAEELEASFRKDYGAGQNIYPAYLDMKNPYVFDAKGESYTYIEDSLTNIIKKAKKQGHDGVIFRNLDDIPGRTNAISDHYVVFEPEQIKSAVSDPTFAGLLEPEAATSSFKVVQPGDKVSGLTVREEVPNMSSISATLDDYEVLSGIREVPRSAFDKEYLDSLSFEKLDERTKDLANQINESKEINPMIVAVDSKGAYIIEGGHRFDALMAQDTKSIPAMVVIDKSDPPTENVLRGLLSE